MSADIPIRRHVLTLAKDQDACQKETTAREKSARHVAALHCFYGAGEA